MPSSKRKRSSSTKNATNRSNKRRHQSNDAPQLQSSLLYQYSFVVPLLAQYLNDQDVLTRLLVLSKDVATSLKQYTIKRAIHQNSILHHDTNRFLADTATSRIPIKIGHVIEANKLPVGYDDPALKKIDVTCGFDYRHTSGQIPSTATHLSLASNFDRQPIQIGFIPNSVTHLSIQGYFTEPLQAGTIPDSVTCLTLGEDFSQPLEDLNLPASITHLILGDYFDRPPSATSIPPSLTHLTFGNCFNQSLTAGWLPSCVTHLTFAERFNQPIVAGILPASVLHLTFGMEFDQPLTPGCLPSSITHLTYSIFC